MNVCHLTVALFVVSLFVITTLMEFLLGTAVISGFTWLMNGGLDDESAASQERFEATARKSAPKYKWRVINGVRTKVLDFT